MYFYYPGNQFPAISVTGRSCQLLCPHCQGLYLKSMMEAETPEKLLTICKVLEEKGVKGCLISGGCDLRGRVPLPLETIARIREETHLILNVHTGLVDGDAVEILRLIDPYISLDIPTPYVMDRLYRIKVTQKEYFATLSLLEGLKVVPHVMVGLSPHEERETITKVREIASSLVLIVFTPTKGTPLFNTVVSTKDVIQTFEVARELFPKLVLGCMRPRLKALEEMAPLFDGIVLPSSWAKEKVEEAGIPSEVKNTCCVVE